VRSEGVCFLIAESTTKTDMLPDTSLGTARRPVAILAEVDVAATAAEATEVDMAVADRTSSATAAAATATCLVTAPRAQSATTAAN
jgi:hypothetical protein